MPAFASPLGCDCGADAYDKALWRAQQIVTEFSSGAPSEIIELAARKMANAIAEVHPEWRCF